MKIVKSRFFFDYLRHLTCSETKLLPYVTFATTTTPHLVVTLAVILVQIYYWLGITRGVIGPKQRMRENRIDSSDSVGTRLCSRQWHSIGTCCSSWSFCRFVDTLYSQIFFNLHCRNFRQHKQLHHIFNFRSAPLPLLWFWVLTRQISAQ